MIVCDLKTDGDMREVLKAFPNIIVEEMAKVMVDWHDKIMPFHFQSFAAAKYGYQKRTPRYLKHKKKKSAYPDNPLMFSGRSARALKLPMKLKFKNGQVIASLGWDASMRYFFMVQSKKNVSAKQPNKPQELKTATAAEMENINKMILERVSDRIYAMKQAESATDEAMESSMMLAT